MGLLIREPKAYTEGHLPYLFAWAIAVLTAASFGSYLAGRYLYGRDTETVDESAWKKAFEGKRFSDLKGLAFDVYADCHLADGSVVSGYLFSYSNDVEETMDRDLLLVGPIEYRSPRSLRSEELEDVGSVTISAAQIRFVAVTYFETTDDSEPAGRHQQPLSTQITDRIKRGLKRLRWT